MSDYNNKDLIHIKNGQVARIESNENPTSIDEIEW